MEDIFIRKKDRDEKSRLKAVHCGELVYLSSGLLSDLDWVRHGFSTRLGGVSSGDTGTMNLGFAREKSAENVRENFRRMCRAIGADPGKLVMTKQTHTVNVRTVREEDAGAGYVFARPYDDVDALVTNVPGLTLVCFSADCIPILAADPVHRAVGAAHSGWKGTVHDIAGNMLSVMQKEYGTDPADAVVAIGPSICADCYEIGEDVARLFREAYAPQLHEKILRKKDGGKYQLDLWQACTCNLMRAGVSPDHIAVTDICTKCNSSLLFSHRAMHGKQGNMGAFIGIREQDNS